MQKMPCGTLVIEDQNELILGRNAIDNIQMELKIKLLLVPSHSTLCQALPTKPRLSGVPGIVENTE